MVYRYHPSENVAVPEGYTCSCSAIKIANLIYDEALQSRASADRHCLSSFLQNLVPWIPIDVCSEPVWGDADDITAVMISWSTVWARNVVKFIVVVYDVLSEVQSQLFLEHA